MVTLPNLFHFVFDWDGIQGTNYCSAMSMLVCWQVQLTSQYLQVLTKRVIGLFW